MTRSAEMMQRKFGVQPPRFAKLGNDDKVVVVPGYNYLHYARIQDVVHTVWNRMTDPTYDLEVEIEYRGNQIIVTGVRGRAYAAADGVISGGGQHAETHLEGGSDAVYIYLSQLLNYRIVPSGLNIQIHRGRMLGETWHEIVQSLDWDLSSYQPAAGACWVLVYADRDGTFGVLASDTADTLALLTTAFIPTPPFGAWALAGVRLHAGQTAIHPDNDIYELRWSAMPYNASSGSAAETISSGAIMAKSTYIALTGEGDADDDLDTINGGAHGSIVALRADGQTITIKHGTGNILVENGEDIILSGTSMVRMLIYDDVLDKWLAVQPVNGIDQTVEILDGDGVTVHTLTYVGGLLTGYGAA